eukprot:6478910-Amphidinium_carterae.1
MAAFSAASMPFAAFSAACVSCFIAASRPPFSFAAFSAASTSFSARMSSAHDVFIRCHKDSHAVLADDDSCGWPPAS